MPEFYPPLNGPFAAMDAAESCVPSTATILCAFTHCLLIALWLCCGCAPTPTYAGIPSRTPCYWIV